ncbi:CBU_0592 family membrane protein [Corynebacterium tapiri]|uniref:Transporter n=1 Tax=Corynebacterium tapiri TaxID=1448266 RepID=A0A5C4U7N5_9CORY|nr:transporter [Corynebacterium tapiri]TNL99711.1 transporter [Corynebacterium tapiri]
MELAYEIGIVSGVLFVVAFGLMNFGVIKAESVLYQVLNLFGALGFTYTAIQPFNPGLFVTEAVWAIVAAFGLYKIFTRKNGPERNLA